MRVTSLEPRTQCQPEKLKKLSKNDSVLLFSFSESTKSVRIYRVCFQPSAARPQGCDRIWCRAPRNLSAKTRDWRGVSGDFRFLLICLRLHKLTTGGCENPAVPASGRAIVVFPSQMISIVSSESCLSLSSLPVSSKEFVRTALPFSTLVIR